MHLHEWCAGVNVRFDAHPLKVAGIQLQGGNPGEILFCIGNAFR
jgi:hypothetical protein